MPAFALGMFGVLVLYLKWKYSHGNWEIFTAFRSVGAAERADSEAGA